MAPFDECSVLLPSATLEDFPVGGPDSDARSLLAGWTVLWHPRLLAETEQMPTWYRADAPPIPDGPRVVVVPDPSLGQLPSDFRRKCEANPNCLWVTGADRGEMLSALELDPNDPAWSPIEFSGRQLGVEDFYAVGFLSLQIQIMTRRLRYTSNLDELHLQNRITQAAKAFRDRDAAATAEGLHDVFDCLSEERDHYFSSDPHLIDLTLLTPGVLDVAIEGGWVDRIGQSANEGDEGNGILGTPRNVLIDGQVAAQLGLARDNPQLDARYEGFRQLLSRPTIGWAGGGGANETQTDQCLDAMTMAAARGAFEAGTQLATEATGVAPDVFARLSGMTPVDLIPALAALGYKGVIPIDFTAGTGFGDESKVIVSGGGAELEALTAKPIDAASDAAFLSIGAQLGESIDTGEVSTALLVHWPDRVCDSFRDLCRAATWSVALGRFWTLQQYFTDGERPYHNGTLDTLSKHASAKIAEQLVAQDHTLQSMANAFADAVRNETRRTARSIAVLAKPGLLDENVGRLDSLDHDQTNRTVYQAIGVKPLPVDQGNAAKRARYDLLCFNPQGGPERQQAVLSGAGPGKETFVYAATDAGHGKCQVTFDVPAMGFTRLAAIEPVKKQSLLKRITGSKKNIAESALLRNEFMAVSLDDSTGGIAGVYSATRGNRLSVKLVAAKGIAGDGNGGQMVCRKMRTAHSDLSKGVVQAEGAIENSAGKPIAEFQIQYQLQRGSRRLQIEGTITPKVAASLQTAADVWNNYFAMRTAVAGEAAIVRALVRDKVHSSSSKKLVAPLGVLIDEAEKQTLVVSHGLPLHRKVGDRFVDTLLAHPGAEQPSGGNPPSSEFQITIAIDCPAPVALARSCIAPTEVIQVEPQDGDGKTAAKNNQAWLVHVSPSDVLVTEMTTARRRDGKLAARIQLVQTRPKSSRVKIQFCVFAHAAFFADPTGIDRPLEELPEDVTCNDGVVELTLGNHEAVDLIVVFDV